MTMKKPFSTFAILIASTAAAAAEDSSFSILPAPLDFLAVKDFIIITEKAFIGNDQISWDGPSFHTGIQMGRLTCCNIKDVPDDAEAPKSPSLYIRFTDAYGNLASSHEYDLYKAFNKMGFSETLKFTEDVECAVSRGGLYTVEFGMTPELFKHEQQIIIEDEACARVYGTYFKKGEQAITALDITSGYPFEPSSLKGQRSLDWALTSAESPTLVLAGGSETFSLESDRPLIASAATVALELGSLEPGRYLCMVSSDFSPASHAFNVEVDDVLQAEVFMDKEQYLIGKDGAVDMRIAMKYGYPYISTNPDTGKPTIIVKAVLCGQEYIFDFSNEEWKDSEVNYTARISVPLTDVTYGIACEYDWNLPLDIKVIFNGATQMEKSVGIPIADSSGIESINADSRTLPKHYNLFGQRVNNSYRGITITSDGSKILTNGY